MIGGLRSLVIAAGLAACSSKSHTNDAMLDAFPTAPHTAYPQLPNHGGPTLPHPQLVTITFANDARASTLESFAQWIVGSRWLAAVGSEYGDAGFGIVPLAIPVAR